MSLTGAAPCQTIPTQPITEPHVQPRAGTEQHLKPEHQDSTGTRRRRQPSPQPRADVHIAGPRSPQMSPRHSNNPWNRCHQARQRWEAQPSHRQRGHPGTHTQSVVARAMTTHCDCVFPLAGGAVDEMSYLTSITKMHECPNTGSRPDMGFSTNK